MTTGHVRDRFPRLSLELPGRDGDTLRIEFIVDTGFDGELALPAALMREVDAEFSNVHLVQLADGSLQRRPYYSVALEWQDEERLTEIAVMDSGNPLLGVGLLAEQLLQVEVTDGGEVTIEPL